MVEKAKALIAQKNTISSASLAWSDQPDQPRSLSPSLATQKIRKFLRNEWQPLILSEAAP
jgi:hypothetical protein